jgi:CheY-like chemotaxis protein/DNA-binding CsgD family transcriptional regulator
MNHTHLKKILIVDDDISIVDITSDVLANAGYEIFAAFNGKQAIDVAKQENIDLIILDWEMPVKDGIETLKTLKNIPSLESVPVIMISGRMTSIENLKKAFDAGAIDFIRKPVDPVELTARVRSMLMLAEYYNESVRKKDWELTLLSKTNLQNDEMLNELIEFIDKMYVSCKSVDEIKFKELKDMLNRIKANIKNNSWEQFQYYYKNVHPDFSDNLMQAFPKITNEELRLCYFLRMNMSSKEIASITNREIHSIDVARYRLRKKFDIDRNEKLHEFLMQF